MFALSRFQLAASVAQRRRVGGLHEFQLLSQLISRQQSQESPLLPGCCLSLGLLTALISLTLSSSHQIDTLPPLGVKYRPSGCSSMLLNGPCRRGEEMVRVEDTERCKGIDQRCNTVMCDGSALIDF